MTAPTLRGFRSLLGQELWDRLAEHGTLHSFAPNSTLLRQGDPGGHLMMILSGRVTVHGRDPDGGELLVSLRGAGDLVGELARNPVALRTAHVRTLDRCTIQILSPAVFDAFLTRNRAHNKFADYLTGKLGETIRYKMQLAHFPAQRRLALLFLELIALADPHRPDRYRIPLSQEALASALGLARSTVAEQIATYRTGGALSASRRITVADVDRLRLYAYS